MILRRTCYSSELLWLLHLASFIIVANHWVVEAGARAVRHRRSLYHQRSSILEDFVIACGSTFQGNSVDQNEFALFIVEYCNDSPEKGDECPGQELAFSSLPLSFQLSFVDCPPTNAYDQIDCLRNLMRSNDILVHYGPTGSLCARTFPLMKSTNFLRDNSSDSNNALVFGSNGVQTENLRLKHYPYRENTKPNVYEVKAGKKKIGHPIPSVAPTPPTTSPAPDSRPSCAPPGTPPPSVQDTWSPSGTPVLRIVEVQVNSGAKSQVEELSSRNQRHRLQPPAIFGGAIIAAMLIGLLISKGVSTIRQERHARSILLDHNIGPFMSGDASISSEPSQMFQREEEDTINSTGLGLPYKLNLLQLFSKPNRRRTDPLEKSRAKSHFHWTTQSSQTGSFVRKSSSSDANKRETVGSMTSATDKCTCEPLSGERAAESGAESRDVYPAEESTIPCTATCEEFGENDSSESDSGYFLDIVAMEAYPESAITDSSEDSRPRRASKTLRRGRFLFSRQTRSDRASGSTPGSSELLRAAESQSLDSSNREAHQENEALEDMENNFNPYTKPWRSTLRTVSRSGSPVETKNTPSTQESGRHCFSFLSPDVMKQFDEVDQKLSDGLKQLQEEDRKLSDEMEKLTISMSSPSKKPLDEDSDDDFSNSSCNGWYGTNEDQGLQGEVELDITSVDSVGVASAHDDLQGDDWEKRSTTRHNEYELSDEESVVSIDDRRFDFSRLQDHFKSKWCENKEWKKTKLRDSPPDQKKKVYLEATRSSLLPSRVASEEDDLEYHPTPNGSQN